MSLYKGSTAIAGIPTGLIDTVNNKADVSYVDEELEKKANTDLDNLSDDGKKVIDGQWVAKTATLSTATAVGTYTIDLSSYLPDDNYNYEILISMRAVKSSSDGSFYATIYSDAITNELHIAQISTYSRGDTCCSVLPLSTTKKMYYVVHTKTCNDITVGFVACGYRRIGTNV